MGDNIRGIKRRLGRTREEKQEAKRKEKEAAIAKKKEKQEAKRKEKEAAIAEKKEKQEAKRKKIEAAIAEQKEKFIANITRKQDIALKTLNTITPDAGTGVWTAWTSGDD